MNDVRDDGTPSENGSMQTSGHPVSRATYPLPQSLRHRLESASKNRECVVSTQEALAQLVGNSLEAMDAMYFSNSPQVRQHASFQHRLCLRVKADPQANTLSITDLGVGMTRADLINSLGVGRPMPVGVGVTADDKNTQLDDDATQDTEQDEDDDDDDDTSLEGDSQQESSSQQDESSQDESSQQEPNDINTQLLLKTNTETPAAANTQPLPCKVNDVGGFYAALAALGVAVQVGTKSKFDDYYEFELGTAQAAQGQVPNYAEFTLSRPMEEGCVPTASNGFAKFEDVRGESGTRVTLHLQPHARHELLDEHRLKPMLTKILETTQYTVAFSTDHDADDIVAASAQEQRDMAALLQDHSETEAVLENDDIHPSKLPDSEKVGSHKTVKERAKYIPLRLSLGERKMLRLMEASMNCCEYTTDVDRTFKSATRRTHAQLKGITYVLRGLVTACDYAAGQHLLQDDDNIANYQSFFRQMFEIARRHKIMNPEKMRTEYGKLIYLLQDSVSPNVQPLLGSSLKGPIESVYKFLEERQGLPLLSDKLIETATEEILAGKKSRSKINAEIKRKERAVATLKQKYRSSRLSSEDIHLCLYSICDNNSFLNSNRVPVDKVIDFLQTHFSPDTIEEGYSLSIVSGQDGARLSHSHERQYYFALQSLTLWREIIDDMFRLWAMAEEDLLSETVTYSLKDTGQGMQRVQQSPRTYKAMQTILVRVQEKVKHWVGSSVIHMGDHNVPNALSFIDKYTQVPRILGPIVSCLENLDKLCEKDSGISKMVQADFGGMEKLRKDILYDFFRSALNGGGADNFYDAGSCIDGRLTSAWNWCSQLPDKSFYPIFKLTGFTGFDGEFK